jgi:hypothetical protein
VLSLGGSTVQLHDNLGSRRACACSEAGFRSQNGDHVEERNIEEQRSVVRFLWAKRLSEKDIHKEMLPVYGGKCLSRKVVHNWAKKFSQGHSKVADDETEVRKWLRQQSNNFYAVGFDALVKGWDKCIKVGGGYAEKCFFQI